MIKLEKNNLRLVNWLEKNNNQTDFYQTILKFNNIKTIPKKDATEYILKSISKREINEQYNNRIIKWKLFLENNFNLENMIKIKNFIRKITICCGPPGSGKSINNNSFIIDFDLIAKWFYKRLRSHIPPYILADYKPFRKYIRDIETSVIKILCDKYSIFQPDVTICCCNCKRIIDLIDTMNNRFSILLNIKYCELPKYKIWSKFQKHRKLSNSINYRTFNEDKYNKFKIEGEKLWEWIQELSKKRPEIYIEKIDWSDEKNKTKFIRPVYTLAAKGILVVNNI
jgi:hypothetical protein